MAVIDFHIHLYKGYSLERAITALRRNTAVLHPTADSSDPIVLCLTERQGQHWFRDLATGRPNANLLPQDWKHSVTDDGLAIKLDLQLGPVFLVAGRQIITRERLELLCLGRDLDLADGVPVRDGIAEILKAGGIPVIPWSPGKWMFERGKLLHALLDSEETLYLGDTAIRCHGLWSRSIFNRSTERGFPSLPGSDPLPAKGEESNFGKLSTQLNIPCENPASEILEFLANPKDNSIPFFPSKMGIISMVQRQLNFRLRKIQQ